MTSTDLNTYVTFGYLAAGICYLVFYISGVLATRMRMAALGLFILVFAVHSASIGLRWIESYQMGVGHAPLSNLYESLVFFAWTIALALIIARLKFRTDMIVLLGMPAVFLTMAYTFLQDPEHQAVDSGSSVQLACRSCNHLLSGLFRICRLLCGCIVVAAYSRLGRVRQTSCRHGYPG